MGSYCTSSIEAVERDDRIHVTYYVDHHGHDLDFRSLVHMRLPRSEKNKIAGMVHITISLRKRKKKQSMGYGYTYGYGRAFFHC